MAVFSHRSPSSADVYEADMEDLIEESEEEKESEEESEEEIESEEESEVESEENSDDSNCSVDSVEVKDDDRYCPLQFNPETYPPEWKPIKESPQYNHGLINRFVQAWMEYPHDVLDELGIKKFISQIMDSRGYDFDGNDPPDVNHPFYLKDPSKPPIHPKRPKVFAGLMDFVVASINTHAMPHGEKYAFDKMERIVMAWVHWIMLLTFSVKAVAVDDGDVNVKEVVKTIQAMVYFIPGHYRLVEWRFKPEAKSMETSDATSMEVST